MNKYVIHAKPSEELEEKLLSIQEEIRHKTTKLTTYFHTTLLTIRAENPEIIHERLKTIRHPSMYADLKGFEAFDNNSIVLTLNSKQLKKLHNKILVELEELYDAHPSTTYVGKYYNPHITIAEAPEQIIAAIPPSRLCSFHINEFILSEKNREWKHLEKYKLD
jgi:2'-5' RNA ligase